jgi:DNA-3-methyladenine glycosylase I
MAELAAQSPPPGLRCGADGKWRCAWCGDAPDYVLYHDDEWGVPVVEDRRLFEKMVLEGFQSGLSWLTILRKREAFRAAFANFDFVQVANFGQPEIDALLGNAGIVRHRGKIEAAINNARRVVELADACGSLAAFVWQFEASQTPDHPQLLTQTEQSAALSKALKKRGFSFVGPVTMHAFMQSMGLVNDHPAGCHVRASIDRARRALVRPTLGRAKP